MIIVGKKLAGGDQPSDIYPKVIFRSSGGAELLTKGTPTLLAGDYLVEPVKEGFGDDTLMVYISNDGAYVIKAQLPLPDTWVSPNGSVGYNYYNNTWLESSSVSITQVTSIIDNSLYFTQYYPFIVDFTDFILAGFVVEISTTKIGALKIYDDGTYEFIGFLPDTGNYDATWLKWDALDEYSATGSTALRGAVVTFGLPSETGITLYHIDAYTGVTTPTYIEETGVSYNSLFFVDDMVYIFTSKSSEAYDGDLFVYQLQDNNTFSLAGRHSHPVDMQSTGIAHGGYGMSLTVKSRDNYIFVTDWGDSGNVRVRAYYKSGEFLWSVDDTAGAGIFSDVTYVYSNQNYVPTTQINTDSGNILYGAIVDEQDTTVNLRLYEIDHKTGALISSRVLLENVTPRYFELLGYHDGVVYVGYDWVELHKINILTGDSQTITLVNDIVYDSIYATTKDGSLVFPNYAYGVSVVPMGNMSSVIEYDDNATILDYATSGSAYLLRGNQMITISRAAPGAKTLGGVRRYVLS